MWKVLIADDEPKIRQGLKSVLEEMKLPITVCAEARNGMEALENKDPLDILAYQYDLVCNGYEMASGAVRNHDPEIMVKAFEIAGYTEEDVKNRFGALYNAFQYGTPPHAGAAPGLDRMVMLVADSKNIREVIAFPKNKKARDLLMRAPSRVHEQQLKDVHIRIVEKEK